MERRHQEETEAVISKILINKDSGRRLKRDRQNGNRREETEQQIESRRRDTKRRQTDTRRVNK